MSKKVVIIGGTAAGLSAASRIKKLQPATQVIVFEMTGFISYGSCGLPYFVQGLIDEPFDLVSFTVERIKKERDIIVFDHTKVIDIDDDNKKVLAENLLDGTRWFESFDEIVFATGADAIKPDIQGIDAKGVFFLKNVEDGIQLRSSIRPTGKAVIIGGGMIGLEVAEALSNSGMEVRIVEQLPRLLPAYDPYYSELLMDELNEHNVDLYLNESVVEILTSNGHVSGVRLSSDRILDAELVVVSIGVKPRSSLAAKIGVRTGLKGAIEVDQQMRTNIPYAYACGDCVETVHILNGKKIYMPLGTTANKQGRVCGNTIAGYDDYFPGVLGTNATKVFDLYIASTGLNLDQASHAGFTADLVTIKNNDLASYYPNSEVNHISLIFDKETGQLLGAQAAGSSTIAGRINTLVACVTAKMTIWDLYKLDFLYTPSLAPVYDPLIIAASQAIKKVGR